MDLLQAEAVADLIHAVSEGGKKLASRTLEGRLSDKVSALRQELTDIASILELELDFSDQEITTMDRRNITSKLHDASAHLLSLRDSYSGGKILREGAMVPIVGKPNAGKSSLLNALLEEERAIISHIPGTTRDTIEESFIHKGVVFRLIDTAGLRDTEDPIEKIGTKRAIDTLERADLILLVVDLSDENDLKFEQTFLSRYAHKRIVVVFNKSDLPPKQSPLDVSHSVFVSALHHENISKLTDMMANIVNKHFHLGNETVAITRQRHKQALQNALDALDRCENALKDNMSNEFLALDIREAITALDDITGHTTSEDVLNNIFDQFCVGK
jgi:tRNA modification GTPase